MEAAIDRNPSARTIDFKGRMVTLNVIRVRSEDLHLVNQHLQDKVNQAPDFFRHLPVLIDLDHVPGIDLDKVCDIFTEQHLAVMALIGGNPELDQRAREKGLVVLSPGAMGADRIARQETAERQEEKAKAPSAEPSSADCLVEAEAPGTPTLLIKHPVRSGQQIYARGGDLIVLASVGAGAEVLADGHVHIYGPLRGRALAGVQGDTHARIFCQSLEAELISVAGSYIISDDIPAKFRGKGVQVSLGSNDLLRMDPL